MKRKRKCGGNNGIPSQRVIIIQTVPRTLITDNRNASRAYSIYYIIIRILFCKTKYSNNRRFQRQLYFFTISTGIYILRTIRYYGTTPLQINHHRVSIIQHTHTYICVTDNVENPDILYITPYFWAIRIEFFKTFLYCQDVLTEQMDNMTFLRNIRLLYVFL